MRTVAPAPVLILIATMVLMESATVSIANEGSLSRLSLAQESMHGEYKPGDLKPDPLGHVAPSRDHDALHLVPDLEIDPENQRIWGSATHTIQWVADKLAPMLDDWYMRTRELATRALDNLGMQSSVNDLRVRAQIEKVPWVAERMEAAANGIEARSPRESKDLEDLVAKVKGLQDSIQELEKLLAALTKKVGEVEVSP